MSNIVLAADTGLPEFLPRRGFLRGLASLPLIGGGITLIGSPTRAAEPVTEDMLRAYSTWLAFERRYLHHEMDPHRERHLDDFIDMRTPASMYHYVAYGDPMRDRERPSTRAAVVLAAIGCEWRRP